MLLASLNPATVAAGIDIGDAVRIGGAVLSRSDLVGAGTSVAERVAAADRVAVLATPTAATVLAITGCLIAGVPVVPVMSAAASDSSYLRNAGIPTYGHSGLAGDVDDVRAHGKDERVAVQAMFEGEQYLYELVKELSGG